MYNKKVTVNLPTVARKVKIDPILICLRNSNSVTTCMGYFGLFEKTLF